MKKTLIALAAVAASGAAMAQSSVTLFGNIDMGIRHVNPETGPSITSMSKNLISSSAIGFRGVEDLGGGMSAAFHLEGDLDPDTGTPGGLQFRRRSTVSLIGGFGELRLGRDYTPTFTVHTKYDPFGTNGLGSSINMFNSAGVFGAVSTSGVRSDNGIGYLAKFGSFDVAYMYAPRESATNNNDYHGIRAGYNAGPLSVDVAAAQEVGSAATVGLHNPSRVNFGVAYDFGFIKPMFQYTTAKLEFAGGEIKANNVLVGLTAPVGPGLLRFSYVRTNVEDVGFFDESGKQIALGYTYPLSKRTSFNANIARISTNAAFTAETGIGEQTGYEIGIRHTF
ncbi:MAG TPA: porin [Hydrogenophaga sp.]|uniref:porin n=1 Tax=Hydrogenophaga sp. TaxID=1904254 RepID=UPI002C88F28F|nr:porin [Hydrogenophaga sp.]HSX94168.1 porin [Hydrogenophaga sp.]